MRTRQIILKNGMVATVDEEDYDMLMSYKWDAAKSRPDGACYARQVLRGPLGKTLNVLMHRVVLGIDDSSIQVDHIDHNGLNNCKSNLRIATAAQNTQNRRSFKNSTSRFKGVSLERIKKKDGTYRDRWRAQIKEGDRAKFLGYFETEEEAAIAYNKSAIRIQGEFACLNVVEYECDEIDHLSLNS